MNNERGLTWRLAKLGLSSRARLYSGIRFGFHRLVSIPYHRRLGHDTLPLPANINIIPTYRCNLKCVMCSQRAGRTHDADSPPWYDPKREITVEQWIPFLDQISTFRPIIYWSGGEPLMYPGFKDLVHQIKKRKLIVHMATNGVLLPNVAEYLVKEGIEGISISLDGPPEVHDRVRGVKGAFNGAAEGAKALVEARRAAKAPGPTLSFAFTITKPSYQGLEEAVEHAIAMNGDFFQVGHVGFKPLDFVARHNSIFSEQGAKEMGLKMDFPAIRENTCYEPGMEEEDIENLAKIIDRTKRLAKRRIRLSFVPPVPFDLIGPYYRDMDYPFVERCDYFWTAFSVGPDGRVSPCLNFLAGNITENTMEELWNGETMRRLRKLFRDGLLPGCIRCCHRYYSKTSPCF